LAEGLGSKIVFSVANYHDHQARRHNWTYVTNIIPALDPYQKTHKKFNDLSYYRQSVMQYAPLAGGSVLVQRPLIIALNH